MNDYFITETDKGDFLTLGEHHVRFYPKGELPNLLKNLPRRKA